MVTEEIEISNDEEVNTIAYTNNDTIKMKIENAKTKFNVDTGASLTLVSQNKFQEHQRKGKNALEFQPSKKILKVFTGERKKSLSKVIVNIAYEEQFLGKRPCCKLANGGQVKFALSISHVD